MNPLKQTLRCPRCMKKERNVVQAGLAYIDSYTGDGVAAILETKTAFLALDPIFQEWFVDLVEKTGIQVMIPYGTPATPAQLLEEILLKWRANEDQTGSPEAQEFKDLLATIPDGFGEMSPMIKTLLSNLFQVMDNSEKAMLTALLKNPKLVEAFLKNFSKTPQDRDLLRNTRALLYDYDRQAREYEEQFLQKTSANMRQVQSNMNDARFQKRVKESKQRQRERGE
ncbi:MAG: hypothetical protein LBU87_04515 [Lactobacillales bacterium]|nr:hypothetical protein [Lactobacillales bacterium]